MSGYIDITELIDRLENKKDISALEVVNLAYRYKDSRFPHFHSEYEKWILSGKNADEILNMKYAELQKKRWIKGNVKVSDLGKVYMSSVGWLRKFACTFENCVEYTKRDECISCPQLDLQYFTLNEISININLSGKSPSRFYNGKIKELQKGLKTHNDNLMVFVKATCIESSLNAPYFFDGNSRAVSIATMPELLDHKVICIAENK